MNRIVTTSIALAAWTAVPAQAADSWSTPFAGVRRLVRTTTGPNERIHALFVDLDMPGVQLAVTPYSLTRRTTSSLGRTLKAQAAVNGDLFNTTTFAVNGLAIARGVAYPRSRDDDWNATLQFNRAVSRVELSRASAVQAREPWMWGLISGHPSLIEAGAVLDRTGGVCASREPRTGVGLSANGRQLIVVVVDGRASASAGMTCNEFGRLLKQLGAASAVNLDGGGSSAMWIAGKGVVNRPSDGAERTVANHLAIFAKSANTVGVLAGTVTRADTGAALKGAVVKLHTGKSVKTDAQGKFRLGVPAGTYRFTIARTGFATQTLTRKVTAKKTTRVAAALKRVATPAPQGIAGTESAENTALSNIDSDLDGVVDREDNCVHVANATQTDADDDAIGDACDDDSDSDGVADEEDDCALVANPDQADRDGNGTGDACDEGAPAVADDTACADSECDETAADSELEAELPIDLEQGGCASANVGMIALVALAAGVRRRRTRNILS